MTPETPHRRFFQFGLRGIFVAMTLLAFVLAYQANWLRQRREFLSEQIDAVHVWTLTSEDQWIPNDRSAPGLLWLFGEHGHSKVILWSDSRDIDHLPAPDAARVERAKKLFPESAIRLYNADGQTSWTSYDLDR